MASAPPPHRLSWSIVVIGTWRSSPRASTTGGRQAARSSRAHRANPNPPAREQLGGRHLRRDEGAGEPVRRADERSDRPMTLLGLGTALVYPTLLAAISDVAHPDWRASAVGVYRLWRGGGYAIGALIAGGIWGLLGGPWGVSAVAAAG